VNKTRNPAGIQCATATGAPAASIPYNPSMDNTDKVAELETMIAQMEQQIKTAEQLIETCKTQIAYLRDHVARIRALPEDGQQ
jgi:uncharacterized protein HemX